MKAPGPALRGPQVQKSAHPGLDVENITNKTWWIGGFTLSGLRPSCVFYHLL